MNVHMTRLAPLALMLASGLAFAQASEAPQAEAAAAVDAKAAADATAAKAEADAAEAHRAVEAEAVEAYEKALMASEAEQRAALKAVEAARRELQAKAARDSEQARDAQSARHEEHAQRSQEIRQVQRELEKAQENLRRASREVARVHREIGRPRTVAAPGYNFVFSDDRPVLGVILGSSRGDGVEVLGVSPDGPAERAGMAQGDVIVAIMGEPLSEGDEDARAVFGEVMEGVKAGDELVVAVDREGTHQQFTVVPEKREPITYYSHSRLPSAPGVHSNTMVIKQIEVPHIDRTMLESEMVRLQEELEHTRVIINGEVASIEDGSFEIEYDFREFSEFGEGVLSGSNVWFGMPMTRGLKMAEVDAGLGDYFDTDRGVLVLKAREDNQLQLQAGDVILQVDGTEVNKPTDVMRALRNLESGAELDIDIMRKRKSQTLVVEVPENRVGFMPVPPKDVRIMQAPKLHEEIHVLPAPEHD